MAASRAVSQLLMFRWGGCSEAFVAVALLVLVAGIVVHLVSVVVSIINGDVCIGYCCRWSVEYVAGQV